MPKTTREQNHTSKLHSPQLWNNFCNFLSNLPEHIQGGWDGLVRWSTNCLRHRYSYLLECVSADLEEIKNWKLEYYWFELKILDPEVRSYCLRAGKLMRTSDLTPNSLLDLLDLVRAKTKVNHQKGMNKNELQSDILKRIEDVMVAKQQLQDAKIDLLWDLSMPFRLGHNPPNNATLHKLCQYQTFEELVKWVQEKQFSHTKINDLLQACNMGLSHGKKVPSISKT
jgi:hypothetical protein